MTPRLSSACSNQLSYSRMLDLLCTMYEVLFEAPALYAAIHLRERAVTHAAAPPVAGSTWMPLAGILAP